METKPLYLKIIKTKANKPQISLLGWELKKLSIYLCWHPGNSKIMLHDLLLDILM